MDPVPIIKFLEAARGEGYNVLSLSGGEPFLYRNLGKVLSASREMGYYNLVASNGMLLKGHRAQEILPLIDMMAISIDGQKPQHDSIRNLEGAFDKMLEGVELIRREGTPFGFIHTLTPKTWDILPWLTEFAHAHGARLLQFHPLEMYGRAKTSFEADTITQTLLHKMYIMGHYLKSKYFPDMLIQMDFLHKDHIRDYPETVLYYGAGFKPVVKKLSDVLHTLVINEEGDILPVSYGFSSTLKLGNIYSFKEEAFARYIDEKWESLYHVLAETYHQIIEDKENDLFAWTELIVKNSRQSLVSV